MKKEKHDEKDHHHLDYNTDGDDPDTQKYILQLYITGATPSSARAIKNLKKICEEHLHNRYELEVIDIYQQPQLTIGQQIIAAPTLIKKLPLPLRTLIGDLSDTDRVLMGLNLKKKQ